MKTRLLGAAVLLALAVIIVPMLFSSAPPKTDAEQSLSLEIPAAPDRDLQSRTLDVSSPGSAPAAARTAFGTPPATTVTPGNAGQLASVDIASRRPPDVEANAPAATPAGPTPSTAPAAAPTRAPANKPPVATPAATPAPAAPLPTGTAARGSFSVNLSAYADRGKADALVQKVRGLGYPVSTAMVTQAGKQLTRVNAGPFDTRTAAEAARLKIKSAVPGVPASLSGQVADQKGDAPALAAATPRASAPAAAAPAAASPAPGPHVPGRRLGRPAGGIFQRGRRQQAARQGPRGGCSRLRGRHRQQYRCQALARPRWSADPARRRRARP